jgi:hypothetical protein
MKHKRPVCHKCERVFCLCKATEVELTIKAKHITRTKPRTLTSKWTVPKVPSAHPSPEAKEMTSTAYVCDKCDAVDLVVHRSDSPPGDPPLCEDCHDRPMVKVT